MKLYAVGGAIRDTLMGAPVHDVDYVVVGSTVEEMLIQGFRPVGKDFPVFLHPETQAQYALARTERKTGKGYKGFVFHADPTVTLEQDLERRDLTINAMAQEVNEAGEWIGPIIDPYNGQQDIAAKIFRHVSDAFSEDPLRLLRIARFAARFPEFTIAPETMHALQEIIQSNELSALSAERVWQELARGFTAAKPMRMIQVLLDTGAAASLLPFSLVTHLAKEEFREELRACWNVVGGCLDVRCALLLMHVPANEIRLWSEHVRMPNEVRDFSEIFSELKKLAQQNSDRVSDSYQAEDVLHWFNRADVWRKPDRGHSLMNLAQQIDLNVTVLIKALGQAQLLNVAELIASIPAADRADGEHIRSAVEIARLSAITQALHS